MARNQVWDSMGRLIRDVNAPDLLQSDQIVNVKDFGAVGNGITDDTTAIQSAINSCLKGIVFFPPGDYLISKTILLKNYVSFIGSGIGSQIVTEMKF